LPPAFKTKAELGQEEHSKKKIVNIYTKLIKERTKRRPLQKKKAPSPESLEPTLVKRENVYIQQPEINKEAKPSEGTVSF